MTMENSECLELMRETKDKLLCYAAAQSWPTVKKSNGFMISTHQETGNPAKIFKAECEVEVPPVELFDYVSASTMASSMMKLQKALKSWEVLKELDQDMFVVRSVSQTAAGGIISSREFLDLISNFKDNEKGIFISCVTGIDFSYPEDPKYVRGRNYPSGMLCFPIPKEPKKSRFVYIIQTHLGGSLPTKLVDMALPSMQASFLSNLFKAVKENKKKATS